eukprot:jgi/Antlo1/2074/2092
MHGKKTLETMFKVGFMLFQSVLFIVGVSLFITSLVFYLNARSILNMSAKMLVYSVILCTLLVSSSISGFKAINSRERWLIALYVILTLTLINLESLFIMKFPALTDNVRKSSKAFWQRIDSNQRAMLEENFGCCGFDSENREKRCAGMKQCSNMFYKVARGFRNIAEKILILLIFSESLSVGLLCLLRLRK